MRTTRIALLAAGLAVVAYGATLLLDNPPVIVARILVWALAAVIMHDAVFAPAAALLGFTGGKLLPQRWRAPIAVAALCSVVLALLAIPVFDKPGRRPDNLTVLDRDYHTGLLISLAVIWAVAIACCVFARVLPIGQNQVIEGQRTNDIDGQPPAS